jgi:uncharacterized protein (TIRG00374 family)
VEKETKNNAKHIRRLIYTLISVAITVGIMCYLLKGVSLRDLAAKAADMDRRSVLCFMFLSFCQLFFRTWRYQILLRNAGEYVGNIAMVLTTQIRNFLSDLLPARLGTLSFVWVTTQRLNVPLESATSTFALAFLFDTIVMAPLIFIALIAVGGTAGLAVGWLIVASILLFVILAAVLWELPWFLALAGRIFGKAKRPAFKYLEARLYEAGAQVRSTRGAGLYTRLIMLSFIIRLLKYSSMYLLFYAWMKQFGYGINDFAISKAFLAIAAAELAASMPFSGIAGFGAYEGTWALTFKVFGLDQHYAVETAVVIHLLTQVWGYSIGVVALLIILLPFFGKKHEHRRSGEVYCEKWMAFIPKFAVSFIATVLIAVMMMKFGIGKEEKITADKPTADEQRARKNIAVELDRKVLFDSNRSGSFGIYIMNPDSSGIRKVVDTKQHEIYPSASPDGEWIAYASASKLAQRASSDVWIVRIDGTDARKVAENGTFPSWSSDGKKIYFERERKWLMAVDTIEGETEELLPKKAPETAKWQLVKPHVSPDGKWAAFISDREGRWNTWIANLENGETRHVGPGCEPTWSPDGRSLIWITSGSYGTCIKKYELDSGRTTLVQDTPQPRPTEYYPSISPDGKYVLYSASPVHSAGQNDTANYQLFIKSLDDRPAVRLTFDPYTNRWPSLLPKN